MGSEAPTGRIASFRASFPLVEAKLHPPLPPRGAVSRPRLLERLAGDAAVPIVSIVAPPGYGKTLLLAEWAALASGRVAWLAIDDFDNEASVFLSYLAAAFDGVEPVDDSIAAALAAPGPRILGAAVPRLAAALHGWRPPGLLILDDVHRLTDPTCLDALTILLDHLPDGVRVALAGRTSPGLPLARFRAHRRLLELGRQELAFDAGETKALVEGTGHEVSAEQARLLAERTEGWAAAIYLATLQEGGHSSVTLADVVSGREGYIADYLRSALRSSLGTDDHVLLERASILVVIEPGVLEAVVQSPAASERLRSLAHKSQLIADVGGGAYRCHHLLREYLRSELERREPEAIPELHRRAASWYGDAGRPELAIEHSIQSGDVDITARLVTAAAIRTADGGHHDRLARWLRQFDEVDFERYPGLCLIAGWMHALYGRPEAADRMAEIADRAAFDGPTGDGAASFASSRAMLRAVLLRDGPDDALANASLAVAAEMPGSPWRPNAYIMLGAARMLKGDTTGAEDAFAEGVRSAPAGNASPFVALAFQAAMAIARGHWRAAEELARESHEAIDKAGIGEVAPTLLVHAVGARVAMHHGDQRRAREELVHAQLVGPQVSYAMPWLAVTSMLELARTYLAIGDPAGARTVVAEGEGILHHRPHLGVLAGQLADMRRRLDVSDRTMSGPSTLTPAELRVLPMLATHLTFEEIGDRLGVTRHTIKAHAVSIYGKLQASGRSETVERAIDIGLLEPFPGLAPGVPAAILR
jgi:LuxR family maltose regulon positive regulatory protein